MESLKQLTKMANRLDDLGLVNDADICDALVHFAAVPPGNPAANAAWQAFSDAMSRNQQFTKMFGSQGIDRIVDRALKDAQLARRPEMEAFKRALAGGGQRGAIEASFLRLLPLLIAEGYAAWGASHGAGDAARAYMDTAQSMRNLGVSGVWNRATDPQRLQRFYNQYTNNLGTTLGNAAKGVGEFASFGLYQPNYVNPYQQNQ